MRVLRWAGRFWTGVLAVAVLVIGLLLGLRVLLPLFASPPSLLEATPPDGAGDVSPRARLTLRFSGPMNPRSVERAIRLDPAVDWAPLWSDDRATLTISPTQSLRPDSSYRLTIGVAALSRRFRALDQPVELSFHTAPAPAVVRVLPADGAADVPTSSPISIRFSRTMVRAGALLQPGPLPALRFEPPVEGQVIWLDTATALFRPAAPLRPGTRYTASLAADLADVAGGRLDIPFSWTFSTPAPKVLDTSPADGAGLVAPGATLAITISQQLDLNSVRASLTISPTVAGALAAADLPGGRQLVTFAPAGGWQPSATYVASLAAGAAPTSGNLPLLAPVSWSFTIAPRPTLIARFPGEGQTLPAGQEISLVFNTSIDEQACRDAVEFTPPASGVRVSSSDAEVRIGADLRAATVYTMTLPAALPDHNGIPLGQEFQIRFLTAPASPALTLPEAPGHLAQAAPDRPASLLVRRTNLSTLSFDLYQLDETTTVRTLGFKESDWSAFQPERYGQRLLRSWRVALADQLNTPAEDRLPLAADGGGLPAGAYYLRLSTLEGPRADLLLLVARTRLTLQMSGATALVWATDLIDGAPLGNLPIALYQGGALIQQSTTDPGGLLRFSRAGGAAASTYVALTSGDQFGAVSGAWDSTGAARDEHHVFLTTDRAAYAPGEQVRFAGVARSTSVPTGTLGLSRAGEVALSARAIASGDRIYQARLSVGPTGVFSDALQLAADAPPGTYSLSASIDGALFQARFVVREDSPASLWVAVQAPPPLIDGEPAELAVDARTPEGLPVASATITWTLDAAPAPLSPVEGYTFGDDEREPAAIPPRAGTGQTDASGRFTLVISDISAGDLPLRYRLTALAGEPGGLAGSAEGSFLVLPAPASVGVRLPSRIFTAGRPGVAELLALDANGQPAARVALRVEVYRRTWERVESGDEPPTWRPRDRLALTRSAVSGADGRASLPLTLPAGGAYRLRVSMVDRQGVRLSSAASLWASAPGFTAWGELPGGQPLLIADRPSYQPGETVTLLVTLPVDQASALVTLGGARGATGQVFSLRAGQPLPLTMPDTPVDVPVTVLIAQAASRSGGAATLKPLPLAATTLSAAGERQRIEVSIAADQPAYAPGATALLTVTTSDPTGVGVPADLILSIAGARAVDPADIAAAFRLAAPPLTIAPRPSIAPPARAQPPIAPASAPALPAPGVYWSPGQRTGPSGVLTLTVQLPDDPADLRVQAWAASADRFGQAQATLAVTRPLALAIETPPGFRAGDEIEVAAGIRNTSPISREVEVSLSTAGLQTQASLTQRAIVGPGQRARMVWPALVLDKAAVSLNVSMRSPGEPPQSAQIQRAILRPGASPPHDGGVALLREYLDPRSGQPLDLTRLRAGQLVLARLTVAAIEPQSTITIQEPLPAGATLAAQPTATDFERVDADAERLTLQRGATAPGIYQQSYMLRMAAAGRYGVPAPEASAPGGIVGVGNTLTLDVLP